MPSSTPRSSIASSMSVARELADDEAAAGERLEEPLVLERHQRDPERRPGDAELLDQPQLGDALPRLEGSVE